MPKTRRNKTSHFSDDQIKRKWYLVDADKKTVGRLSTQVANYLSGRNQVTFSPNVDSGHFVIIINAEKTVLSGQKENNKTYTRYSGYPGGLKTTKFKDIKASSKPEFILRHSIRGMLPKNKLRDKMLSRLYIYKGSEHPHQAQKPVNLELK